MNITVHSCSYERMLDPHFHWGDRLKPSQQRA